MALYLYRLARSSFRHPWRVIATWLALLVIGLGAAIGFGGTMKESFDIPGTESQAALDRLGQVFPQVAGASAQVVVEAPAGQRIDAPVARAGVEDAAADIGRLPFVAQAISPFSQYATNAVSDDGRAALVQVQLDGAVSDLPATAAEEIEAAAQPARDAGLRVEFSGQLFQDLEYGLTVTEAIGVVFAGFVLVVTFGSVLAAGLPLASAIVAVGVTMSGMLLAARLVTLSSATPLLAVMIGLAVGIDYALFVLSRHRRQLAKGMAPEESAATAVGTAGSAVVFAGVTVMIALMGLAIVGIPFLTVMGIAAACAVFVAMTASITLVPAMLGLAGARLAPKPGSRAERRETAGPDAPTLGRRWVRLVLRAPIVFALAVVGILGVVAIPALDLKLALPSAEGQPVGTTARDANDIATEHFGPGSTGPLVVMIDITQGSNATLMTDLQGIADRLREVPGVHSVGEAFPNPTVDSAIVQVVPDYGPSDERTLGVVEGIRALAPSIAADTNMPIAVTGATAIALDISQRLDEALVPFALVVVGLSFVLLTMVFRSLLVPLKAALSFLLSIFAAFGVVVAIFQWGWFADVLGVVPGPIISFMPILLMAIVFGLAMDYEVFLVSGMREAHVHGDGPREAIEHGFTAGARVVTAAALIMFFVFAAFVPEGAGVIKAIALGLAAGIFFDAFLVRMTLVPAVMALMGAAAWRLPRFLERALPNLDVEGETLAEYRSAVAWADASGRAIDADGLVAGGERARTTPISGGVGRGGVLFAVGEPAPRRLVLATIAGRLAPDSGRAHVLGFTIPGDTAAVAQRVAMVDAVDLDERAHDLTLGALIAERADLAAGGDRGARASWSGADDARPGRGGHRVGHRAGDRRVDRLASGVGDELAEELARDADAVLSLVSPPGLREGPRSPLAHLTPETAVDALDPLARAVALVQIGLAERPDVLVVDLGSASEELAAAVVAGAGMLARAGTTIVVGLDAGADAPAIARASVRLAGRGRAGAGSAPVVGAARSGSPASAFDVGLSAPAEPTPREFGVIRLELAEAPDRGIRESRDGHGGGAVQRDRTGVHDPFDEPASAPTGEARPPLVGAAEPHDAHDAQENGARR